MAGQTPALQSSEKSQHFKEKHIFNEHPVPYLKSCYCNCDRVCVCAQFPALLRHGRPLELLLPHHLLRLQPLNTHEVLL